MNISAEAYSQISRPELQRKVRIMASIPEGEAHPASVWIKFAAVPLLLGAVWSHTTIGLWCLVLLAGVVGLMLGVPLSLKKPKGQPGWAMRSALGENLFLIRKDVGIPENSVFIPKFLMSFATSTLIGAVLAAYLHRLEAMLLLAVISMAAKAWFQHRMAELFSEQAETHPELLTWLG